MDERRTVGSGRGRKVAALLAAGAAFGVAVAAVKGQDAGVRSALGNTSAIWILVPFLAGWRCSTAARGALAGAATTLVALLGFYAAEAAILDLGPHPWYVDLRLTLGSGRVYESWGLVSGPAFGALGALWGTRRLLVAPLAVAVAFAAEPLAARLAVDAGLWGGDGPLSYRWLWVAEMLIGGAAIVALGVARRRRAGASP